MAEHQDDPVPQRFSRLKVWGKRLLPVVVLFLLGWLAAWLVQRSYNSPNRQRQLQDWLDENVNADVSLLSSMRMRLNLIRDPRLYLEGLEIEHPNPIFPGKFVILRELITRIPSYALFGLSAGKLDLRFWQLKVGLEQNEFGEWSYDGFLDPLLAKKAIFPFPMPLVNGFKANFRESELTVRRRGYEMTFGLSMVVEAFHEQHRVLVRAPAIPVTFTNLETGEVKNAQVSAPAVSARYQLLPGGRARLTPENCEFLLTDIPCEILPFFFSGLPAENIPGSFSGLLNISDDSDGVLWARLEGEVKNAPLAMFGLPPSSPVRLRIPIGDQRGERAATIRLGPSGFGGFDLRIPLKENGAPKMLELYSDIVTLENIATVMAGGPGWPEWFSTLIPMISWRATNWRGYGWEGNAFLLNMSRSTSGLNLLAEGEMFGGKVKAAMNPGREAPVTASAAAEKIDAKQLGDKLGRMFPAAWRPAFTDGQANLTWRGTLPGAADGAFWNFGIVLVKPTIDLTASGAWWRGVFNVPRVLAEALPDWGGGDGEPLLAMADSPTLALEQVSIVSIRDDDTGFRIEFVAQNNDAGEVGGWIDFHADGAAAGELFMVGPSPALLALREINPRLAAVMDILAATPEGLRSSFTLDADHNPSFVYRFLDDAKRLAGEMEGSFP